MSAAGRKVVIRPEDFRLPEVLRHIEAGRVIVVLPDPPRPQVDITEVIDPEQDEMQIRLDFEIATPERPPVMTNLPELPPPGTKIKIAVEEGEVIRFVDSISIEVDGYGASIYVAHLVDRW